MSQLLIVGSLVGIVSNMAHRLINNDEDERGGPTGSPAPRRWLEPKFLPFSKHGPINIILGCKAKVRLFIQPETHKAHQAVLP